MPQLPYAAKNMTLDTRLGRYHRIGSPTEAAKVEGDRPLECALCHGRESVGNLVDTMESWWGHRYDRAKLTALYGDLDQASLLATLRYGKPHEKAVAWASPEPRCEATIRDARFPRIRRPINGNGWPSPRANSGILIPWSAITRTMPWRAWWERHRLWICTPKGIALGSLRPHGSAPPATKKKERASRPSPPMRQAGPLFRPIPSRSDPVSPELLSVLTGTG